MGVVAPVRSAYKCLGWTLHPRVTVSNGVTPMLIQRQCQPSWKEAALATNLSARVLVAPTNPAIIFMTWAIHLTSFPLSTSEPWDNHKNCSYIWLSLSHHTSLVNAWDLTLYKLFHRLRVISPVSCDSHFMYALPRAIDLVYGESYLLYRYLLLDYAFCWLLPLSSLTFSGNHNGCRVNTCKTERDWSTILAPIFHQFHLLTDLFSSGSLRSFCAPCIFLCCFQTVLL